MTVSPYFKSNVHVIITMIIIMISLSVEDFHKRFIQKYFHSQYDGAFSEHLEMLSQLGYVCLFSSAFPLAAMAALLGNLLELRGDAFKLCFVLQRPFGRRVSNIGTWQVSSKYISK